MVTADTIASIYTTARTAFAFAQVDVKDLDTGKVYRGVMSGLTAEQTMMLQGTAANAKSTVRLLVSELVVGQHPADGKRVEIGGKQYKIAGHAYDAAGATLLLYLGDKH